MLNHEANLSLQAPSWGAEGRRFGRLLSQAGRRLVERLLTWHERARGRRQLGGLNNRLLRDIGIDRATAQIEADKAFWQG